MRRIATVVLGLVLLGLAGPGARSGEAAGGAGERASPGTVQLKYVTVTISPAPLVLVPGANGEIEISFALKPPGETPEKTYHWNNFDPSTAVLLTLDEPRGGLVRLSATTIPFEQPGKKPSDEVRRTRVGVSAPGSEVPEDVVVIRAEVTYYVCTKAGACLMPRRESFEVLLEIVAPGSDRAKAAEKAAAPEQEKDFLTQVKEVKWRSWGIVAAAVVLITLVLVIPPRRAAPTAGGKPAGQEPGREAGPAGQEPDRDEGPPGQEPDQSDRGGEPRGAGRGAGNEES